MTPPIQQSPTVPQPAPGDSDVRPLTKKELRLLKEAEAKLEKTKGLKRFIWSTVGIVVLTVAITASTLAFGQSAIDGGAAKAVAPVEQRVTTVEIDVGQLKQQVGAVERSAIRSEAMLEMLVQSAGKTPPPKIPVPDGGP